METVFAVPEFFFEQSFTPNSELWTAVNYIYTNDIQCTLLFKFILKMC